ncbi:MAG: signal transduction histidine kinase [uncultured bacterium]|nr:MAG: signal transduction histidine kinase [uncultured bacterium]
MRLRTKVAIIIFLTWGLMLIGMYISSHKILMKSYLDLEHQQAEEKLDGLSKTIYRLATEVEAFVNDTAVWDDTYNFIVDKNPKTVQDYIDANIAVPVFAASNLDIILYYDSKGQPVFTRAVNVDRTKEVPLPEKLSDYTTPTGKLVYQPNVQTKIKGFISIPDGIFIVASHPIFKTDFSGTSRGAFIMARRFSDEILKKIADSTHLNLSMFRVESIKGNPSIEEAYNQLINSNTSLIIPSENENDLFGYLLLRDINEKPIAIFRATMPRHAYLAGLSTIKHFNYIFIIYEIIFILLLTYLLRNFVINRLENLNKDIVKIGTENKFSLRVNEEGSDELTSLEKETNKLLNTINDYSNEQVNLLNQISNELDKTNNYSKKIESVKSLLSNIINFMPSMFVIIDDKCAIEHINTVSEAFLGKSNTDVHAKSLFEIFPFLKSYQKKITTAFIGNTSEIIEKIPYKIENELIYFKVVIYPLDKVDNMSRLAIRIDDITDNVNLMNTLQKNEKLASVGVLTAGIAHELNNPVNFIKSTASSIKRNITDIGKLIAKYADIKSENYIQEKLHEIDELKKSIDLEYTIEETKKLLSGINEGARRTSTITNGLRAFSNIDADKMTKFDVNKSISTTLTMLSDRIKDRIDIITEYGDIPEIDGLPNKLNQVFMNIISNSIDAIANKGAIQIITDRDNGNVVITIKDTGIGISEENLTKIFEPFFTTKEVGSGMGLGLSISFGIITEHKGQIDVKSQVGQGTEVTITLPIHHA